MLKRVLAVIVGLIAGGILISLVEMVSNYVYPMPGDLDTSDLDALAEHIANLPIGAFLMVLLAHMVGGFGAGFVAAKIGGSRGPALVVGGLLFALGAITIAMIPHPLWFAVASLACYFPCAWVGASAAGVLKRAGG